jgi:Subtilase family
MRKSKFGWLPVLVTGLGVAVLLGGFSAIAQLKEGQGKGIQRPRDWETLSPSMDYAPGSFIIGFSSATPKNLEKMLGIIQEFGKERGLPVNDVSEKYFVDQDKRPVTMPIARVHEATTDKATRVLQASKALEKPAVCGNMVKYFDAGALKGDDLFKFIEELNARIRSDPDFKEDDFILEPDTNGYPKQSYSPDWAKAAIGTTAEPRTANGVTVAVLDSGYTKMPGYTPSRSWNAVFRKGLNPGAMPNPNFASTDLDKIKDEYITNGARGHGTGVASIIRGPEKLGTQKNTISLTSDANIYPIQVCDVDVCSSVSIAFGICKAISEEKDPVGVINLSLAGPPNSLVLGAVRDAVAANVTVVASSANLKTRTKILDSELIPGEPSPIVVKANRWNETPGQYVFDYPYFPAAMSGGGTDPTKADGIISVSASQRAIGGFEWAIFSPKSPRWNIDTSQPRTVTNLHSSVDIMAPGREVLALPNDMISPLSNVVNGTSYAAPYVSAAAAILLGRNPTLTPKQLEKVLLDAARLHPVDCPPGFCGAGMVNVQGGLDLLNSATYLSANGITP